MFTNILKQNEMRKAFITITILALGITSFAQNEPAAGLEKASKQKYMINGFWDNWFITLDAGAQMYFGESDNLGSFTDRLTPAFSLSAGKWITPVIGLRAQVTGFNLIGYTGTATNKFVSGSESGYFKQEWDYINVNGVALLNLSAALAGYKADRTYEIIPYAGFGGIAALSGPDNIMEPSVQAGLINKFRLSDALDLNLELKGTMIHQDFDGESGGSRLEGIGAAVLGLTYKFKNRGFTPYVPAAPAEPQLISAEELARLRQQVVSEQARARQLQDEIAAEKAKPSGVVVEKDLVAAGLAVFFDFDKSIVSDKEKVNLGFVAEAIKNYPNEKFLITGHADKATGPADYNQKLSERRAQAVVDMLVNEFGVNRNQLEAKGVGDKENSFPTPVLNRVVILKQ